ncbi:MAG: N-acetyl-gamma-glutamyl-phosphate reductase [Gammaproteobacteria bacterium]|nr:N-acetyl-gamma-glutamyl-phosphate reductase [Gammaproteobacteria bacterium]
MAKPDQKSIGVIGARGHTGQELLSLLLAHPRFSIVFAGSRKLAGKPLSALADGLGENLKFEDISPADLRDRQFDALVLALPNGMAAEYVAAVDEARPQSVVLDLSADYRFDKSWYYGLPELTRRHASGKTRIANPGCYATAMQLALAPVADVLAAPACCFGVSGYSGAGTSPSERNDPDVLANNLLAYQPAGHIHEREVSHHLAGPVRFMPHVAAFFRGIHMTSALTLTTPHTVDELSARYEAHYHGEPLVKLSRDIPRVADNANRHHAAVGGWAVSDDGRQAVVYSTLDNLLKGAATQALQNLNNAFGFAESEGIPHG